MHKQRFIIPIYKWWDGPFYTLGMKIYDTMASRLGLGPSIHLSKKEVLELIPTLKDEDLIGGVQYYDGQFDDSRLAINLAQTCSEYCAVVLNYCKVTDLSKNEDGLVSGVTVMEQFSDEEYQVLGRSVINATGVFVDDIMQMDNPGQRKTIKPSQGIHLVLDKSFLQGDYAIMIPKTSDERVLFAVPWKGMVVVGTTDTELDQVSLEPVAQEEEIEFILSTAGQYLVKPPKRSDVLSVFAGQRPLAAPEKEGGKTREISRAHKVTVSLSGLVTIVSGKWKTYRKIAQDTVGRAVIVAGLDEKPCITGHLSIHGF